MNTRLLHTFVSAAHEVQWLSKNTMDVTYKAVFFTFSTHTWSSMLQESFFYLHAWSSILEYQISLDMWSSMLQNNRFQHTQMDMLQDPIFFIFLTSKIKHVIGFAFSILARGSTGRPIRIGKLGSYLRHRIWGGGKK